MAQWLINLTRNHKVAGSIPGLARLRIRHCHECGGGHRCGSDLALLCLWHRLVTTAPTGPLAWEPPYAAGVTQRNSKKTKKNNNNNFIELFPVIFNAQILLKYLRNIDCTIYAF